MITDGEPADIDECDPLYLRLDARKAAEELDRVQQLPERLPALFRTLTR